MTDIAIMKHQQYSYLQKSNKYVAEERLFYLFWKLQYGQNAAKDNIDSISKPILIELTSVLRV
jgi:hypothetical protein